MTSSTLRLAVQFDVETYGYVIIAAVQQIASMSRWDTFESSMPAPNTSMQFGRRSADMGRHAKVWTVDREAILPMAPYKVVEVAHEYWMPHAKVPGENSSDPYDPLVAFMTDLRKVVNEFHAGTSRSWFMILCGEVVDERVINGHCGHVLIPIEPFRSYACPRHGPTQSRIYAMHRPGVSY